MIMSRFKKAYKLYSVVTLFTLFLFFNAVVYASFVPINILRLQLGKEDDTLDRVRALLGLQKVFTFLAERDKLPTADNPADVLVLFGNDDIRQIEEAARIYREGRVKQMVTSGHRGRLGDALIKHAKDSGYTIEGDLSTISEAEIMKQILVKNGVSEENIILESNSTNTKENVDNIKSLLEDEGIQHGTIILMQKPLQQKRARLTFEKTFEKEIKAGKIRYISYAAYLPDIKEMSGKELTASITLCRDEFRRFEEYGPKGKDHMKEAAVPYKIRNAYAYFFEREAVLLPDGSDVLIFKEIVDGQRQVREAIESQL